jgi:2-(1,2-epoxy-1,2-dihydrophenyl)acetyl-CoA isomerase
VPADHDDRDPIRTSSGAPVTCERTGAVATVTLARPDTMNALDTSMKESLLATLTDVAADESVRAVVLAGSGRAFCVGQDLREHADNLGSLPNDEVWATVPNHYAPIAEQILAMPKPVIAAVNGVAAGAGASMAFACDLRLMADRASYNTAFTSIGLSCDTGMSWTLPRMIGSGRAAELLLQPRTIRADEALTLGLATRVVPTDELTAAAAELAHALAAGPTLAYAAVKRALAYAATSTAIDALAYEGTLMAWTGETDDHRNAVASFLAKEQPTFHGR